MATLLHKPTQEQRILEVLEKAEGDWVSGRVFLHDMYISQFHARIFSLQSKGHNIRPSKETDTFGFKSYRLIPKDTLF
jgi:hypothetical protein